MYYRRFLYGAATMSILACSNTPTHAAPQPAVAAASVPTPSPDRLIAMLYRGTEGLVDWVRNSAEAVKRKETRRAIDLSDKLGHSLAVNLTVYCFKLDRKGRGGAQTPQELLEAAKDARETMQTVIDEAKRLEAENSPLVTHRVIQEREYAERQLADLLGQEFDALRELGRLEDLKKLVGQYEQLLKAHGFSASGEPPITAIVLSRTWMGGAETISYYHNGSAARSWNGLPQPGIVSGKSFGSFSEKDYGELVLALRKLDYLSLKDSYRGDTHDLDGHVLTISSPTGEKTIQDTMADAPAGLARFFDMLRRKAATVGWRPAGSEEERIER